MPKFVLFLILAVALSALSVSVFVWKTRADEIALWNEITAQVPTHPLTAQTPDTMAKSD